jgi:peptidoglycan LD-endopeptidase LytH
MPTNLEKQTMTAMRKRLLLLFAFILVAPLLIPQRARIPVLGATKNDWNPASFWYEPWGASGVHKGVDIFAPVGQPVIAPVSGVVLYHGTLGIGGNVVLMLGDLVQNFVSVKSVI